MLFAYFYNIKQFVRYLYKLLPLPFKIIVVKYIYLPPRKQKLETLSFWDVFKQNVFTIPKYLYLQIIIVFLYYFVSSFVAKNSIKL